MSYITTDGLRAKIGDVLYRWLRRNKDALHGWFKHVKPKPKPKPAPGPVEMYDDITVKLIPIKAEAAAGYVDGKWPTFKELPQGIPHRVSIAVFSRDDANVLDVEPGDAQLNEIVAWVHRERARGEVRPDIYTSISWAQKAVNTLAAAGLRYGVDYRLWTAHYTGQPHLCNSKCGFGFTRIAHATQWTDRAGGKSLDESLCSAEFFS